MQLMHHFLHYFLGFVFGSIQLKFASVVPETYKSYMAAMALFKLYKIVIHSSGIRKGEGIQLCAKEDSYI